MESMEVKKNERNVKGITFMVVFLVAIVGTVILLMNLFVENTSYTSNSRESVSTASLYCTNSSITTSGSFFDLSNIESAEQTIKITLKNDRIDNIFYTANIYYQNNTIAMKSEANLHAKYGLYMQDHDMNMNDLSPNFSVDGDNVKINLFAKENQLNLVVSRVFLIDDIDIENYTPQMLFVNYETKGFSCEMME